METIEKGNTHAQRKNDIVEKLARAILSDRISGVERDVKNNIVEKLKKQRETSNRNFLLARLDSKERLFWNGHVDALDIAIAIVQYEGCEDKNV